MVASSLLLLSALAAVLDASVLEMFETSHDKDTCEGNAKKVTESSTMLIVLLIVGPLASVVLLALNIVIMRFIKNKLVAETEVAMQKCFEVLDNVLVELMPRKIQKQLQTAIGGKSGKATDTKESEAEKDKEGGAAAGELFEGYGEQSAASAVSQVSAQK